MDSELQLNFHVSIQKGSSIPPLQKCKTCCSPGKFHCPFCSPEIFKPTDRPSLKIHLDSHRREAFETRKYTIHRCRLWCRSQAHYHCLYCKATVIRKRTFHNHLSFCREQQQRRAQKFSKLPADLTQRIQTGRRTPSYHMEWDDNGNAIAIISDSEAQNRREASSSHSGAHSFPRSNKCDTVRKMKRNTKPDSSKCHKAVQTDTPKPQDCDEYYFMTLTKLFKKLAPQKKAEVRMKIERLLLEAGFT
ncbi:uncharacterized protein LOC115778281 [Archocentrus centrarchus]|uniref:uncharacterized protein LOC115778281 n=1 Tax=Archocentrus centrarchus TaxID=63155 RepID=UPI0011EA50C9|nr:uncharacterized protein LOC115778281 [Archocentrus centrarchus]